MSKETAKEITLESFISKSIAKQKAKPKRTQIEFDGDLIPFNRPSEDTQLKYLTGVGNAIKVSADGSVESQDISVMFEASRDFVYACCPFLHSKEFRNAFDDIVEPTDIVSKVFGIEGTIDIATEIKNAFDVEKNTEKTVQEIKN